MKEIVYFKLEIGVVTFAASPYILSILLVL